MNLRKYHAGLGMRAPMLVALLLIVVGVAPGCADDRPLDLVVAVDLERYQGLWYEIALLPNRFQDQCVVDTTAQYSLRDDGRVDVVNRCVKSDGESTRADGIARRPDPEVPAKLEVRFAPRWLSWLPLVWGDYQVIALDDQYRWAMIGSPSREFLWILARRPELSETRIEALLDQARAQGFPIHDVVRSPQRVSPPKSGEKQ